MVIDWKKLYDDPELSVRYKDLDKEKDFLYSLIIGELNRISVSESEEEKNKLYECLLTNSKKYYELCIECTELLREVSE